MFVSGCYKDISISILNLLLLNSLHYVNCATNEREQRHLLPLLGYLHGYKIGQNLAFQLPPFVLSPIVILPSVNQQQSVNVQKSNAGENYQENGGTFQIISPGKLISNITEVDEEDNKEKDQTLRNTPFIKDQNKEVAINNNLLDDENEPDLFKQANTNNTEGTMTEPTTEIGDLITTKATTNNEVENLKVSSLHGLYPTALYENEILSTLSITTPPSQINSTSATVILHNNLTLPNIENHNFSSAPQISLASQNKVNTIGQDGQVNGMSEVVYFNPVVVASSETKGYPYSKPWYNVMTDKISITTNSYINDESSLPPAYDDRWQSFPSLEKSYSKSDFRPLAGLYHDGFLHKTLIKKTGFIPLKNIYRY